MNIFGSFVATPGKLYLRGKRSCMNEAEIARLSSRVARDMVVPRNIVVEEERRLCAVPLARRGRQGKLRRSGPDDADPSNLPG